MSRKPAIRAAESSVLVSHGADFFGQDRYPLRDVMALAPYVEASVSYMKRATVAPLVRLLESPASGSVPAADASQVAEQLLKVSRDRRIKPAISTLARALADAAARAAADGEAWTWSVEVTTA